MFDSDRDLREILLRPNRNVRGSGGGGGEMDGSTGDMTPTPPRSEVTSSSYASSIAQTMASALPGRPKQSTQAATGKRAVEAAITRVYYWTMFFLVVTMVLGTAFIAASMDSGIFQWRVENCFADGPSPALGRGMFRFALDLQVDVGWKRLTVTHIASATELAGCYGDLKQGQTYPLGDYDKNGATTAGLVMVALWALGMLFALYTAVALWQARRGCWRDGSSKAAISKWCPLLASQVVPGLVTATLLFYWRVEGKTGLNFWKAVPYKMQWVTLAAADTCDKVFQDKCERLSWEIEAPGWPRKIGNTAMFAFAAAGICMVLIARLVRHRKSYVEELELIEPIKAAVEGDAVVEESQLRQVASPNDPV